MQFASLGSGSKGNATLVKDGKTVLLIDCGFSLKETTLRLQRLGCKPEELTGILLTHEHTDHIRGAGALARKYKTPLWGTRGTLAHHGLGKLPGPIGIDVHETLSIGDLEVQPYPVPHDAREPCQYVINNGDKYFGVLTDVGSTTSYIEEMLSGCDALLLECNHDVEMLADGPYPESLKQRVGGRFGHLSNDQSAEILSRLDTSKLKHLVAAHLSEQNNTVALARQALAEVLGCDDDWVGVSLQDDGLDWHNI